MGSRRFRSLDSVARSPQLQHCLAPSSRLVENKDVRHLGQDSKVQKGCCAPRPVALLQRHAPSSNHGPSLRLSVWSFAKHTVAHGCLDLPEHHIATIPAVDV
ncbi:hypothetical protein VTJ04DRAFT_2705 [Mycothermus thermophilus]|uniref:uncharacterized protein n=1 Tax=Humicola insolens TaxID=85995 RepID=UPI00374362DA